MDMTTQSLQTHCVNYVAKNFHKYDIGDVKCLPYPVIRLLVPCLRPLNLRRLEVALNTSNDTYQDIWMSHYARYFTIYYRRMFRVSDTSDNVFCVVSRAEADYRRKYLEDQFHVLLEDANKITILLQRGVLQVNVDKENDINGEDKACCHVKMEQIKSDMLLCAPFVKSLRIFRSKVLMSPLLKEVLAVLTQTVVCIRLVFLHDYAVLRDTIEHFVNNGNILDLHTIWQPQRCSLPAKYSVDILTLISGLRLPRLAMIDDGEEEQLEDETIAWNPYELYDIAVTGARVEQESNVTLECAAIQGEKRATHISISSFLLTQTVYVHEFIANTLMVRWSSLESFKLACLNHLDVAVFQSTILYLISNHNLRQLCFEDTQFSNPMTLFMGIIRILMQNKDIVMKNLTMLGVGHPFIGDNSHEIIAAGTFNGITMLDLSFSSLNNNTSMPTFCEYIRRDQLLQSLNLNCCKLPSSAATAALFRAVGASQIKDLNIDYNQINIDATEDGLIAMLESNNRFEKLSCSLCGFRQTFLRKRLLPALGTLPQLQKLYIAENKIGDLVELKTLLIQLLSSRHYIDCLDISSNFLSGVFLRDVVEELINLRGERVLFKALNISYNMDRNEANDSKGYVRQRYRLLCTHFLCMILYEDAGIPARHEHLAQM